MFWQRKLNRHPEFWLGVRHQLHQAVGQAAWGLMTAVAMVKSGMSVPESVFMTLIVYAGSAQLAAIPLIVAGAPAWVILATGFCVNLRFVVFSLHLRTYLMHLPRAVRMATGYLVTDIVYVMFTRRFPTPGHTASEHLAQEAYLAGSSFLGWISWMVASLMGVALANIIPQSWGLGFAATLCLVGILCSLASSRLRILAASVAAVVAVATYALPLKLNIVTAIVVAVVVCMLLEPKAATPGKGASA